MLCLVLLGLVSSLGSSAQTAEKPTWLLFISGRYAGALSDAVGGIPSASARNDEAETFDYVIPQCSISIGLEPGTATLDWVSEWIGGDVRRKVVAVVHLIDGEPDFAYEATGAFIKELKIPQFVVGQAGFHQISLVPRTLVKTIQVAKYKVNDPRLTPVFTEEISLKMPGIEPVQLTGTRIPDLLQRACGDEVRLLTRAHRGAHWTPYQAGWGGPALSAESRSLKGPGGEREAREDVR